MASVPVSGDTGAPRANGGRPPGSSRRSTEGAFQYHTRALMRGLELLACFQPASPELSLTDCVERTNLDKATAFRLLTCLTEAGFLHRDAERGLYRVGPALLPVASAFHEGDALSAIAESHVRRLAAETGQTATLSVRDGATTINILVAHSDRPLRRLSYPGERFAIHAASVGKAIAAHMHPRELEMLVGEGELPRFTAKTIVSTAAFTAELEQVRAQGYALDDEEAIDGVRCVGAVVRDYRARPVAAISVAGAAGEFVGEALERYAGAVVNAAAAISAQLGFHRRD
ncbi:MAG TPA: IclR family transcriptional regulator [Chloroflexota bacterium]|jgi:IclR family acetate operon transcriptional repressor|nr:IclR family transcriptional regulator [Chloroflexota bacterium]